MVHKGCWRELQLLQPLKKDLAAAETDLAVSLKLFHETWSLTPFEPAVIRKLQMESLPIANAPGTPTMQRVLGALILEEAAGDATARAEFEKRLPIYLAARSRVNKDLVPKVLADIDVYETEYTKQVEKTDPSVFVALKTAERAVAGRQILLEDHSVLTVTDDKLASLTHDPSAPPPDHLNHIVHIRRKSEDVSIALYLLLCDTVASITSIAASVLPGGIKGDRRIVFKAVTKYAPLQLATLGLARVSCAHRGRDRGRGGVRGGEWPCIVQLICQLPCTRLNCESCLKVPCYTDVCVWWPCTLGRTWWDRFPRMRAAATLTIVVCARGNRPWSLTQVQRHALQVPRHIKGDHRRRQSRGSGDHRRSHHRQPLLCRHALQKQVRPRLRFASCCRVP